MKVKKFLKKKNKIIKKVTGMDLIPKDQIKKTPFKHLSFYTNFDINVLSAAICPYCISYQKYTDCSGCPMSDAGNKCITNPESTWHKSKDIWIEKATKKDKKKLKKLCNQYNKEEGK